MAHSQTILLADRDDIFRRTATSILERAGYTCTSIAGSEADFRRLSPDAYHLLLMDVSEPESPVCRLLDTLRSPAVRPPLIVMTRQPSLESALRAIQWQVQAYLIKPFDIHHLLTTLQQALAHAALRQWSAQQEETDTGRPGLPTPAVVSSLPLEMESRADADVEALLRNPLHRRAAPLSRAATDESASDVLAAAEHDAQSTGAGPIDRSRILRYARSEATSRSLNAFDPLQARLQMLSRREWEVVQLLLANQRPKAIARSLFISLHTARNHLRSIFDKLAVHSQTELLILFGSTARWDIDQ
jgi:DNA-binding NarL/FixJ family response regulator